MNKEKGNELFEQQQSQLQQALKEICSRKGKEKNPKLSAKIFNELGLLYKTKSPDKIKLIQSAALLNAAIIRQPDNQKFQDDRHDLCEHVISRARQAAHNVLSCAQLAAHNVTNLVSFAEDVAIQIKQMREHVCDQLKNIRKIPENLLDDRRSFMEKTYINLIKSLQEELSDRYKKIMVFVSRKCIELMGPTPCEYALVGMGSLARNETTPYSDFEHIILLSNLMQSCDKDSQALEYFRWYSVLFHVIIINLQETIIPSVSISCLNDSLTAGGDWFYDVHTKRGISFDGMMVHACKFPLGRTRITENKPWTTELIKSVDDMVKYLDATEDLKNGYKLGDILTRTCYVDGSEVIYNEFRQRVVSTLKESPNSLSSIRKQLDEDLANFSVGENLILFKATSKINLKKVFYRSITLFISALGRLNDVDENSSFDIINEFQNRGTINEESAQALSHAVAVACHIRLFHYMQKERQQDTIKNKTLDLKKKLEKLTKATNCSCLIKCLATAYILQNLMRRGADVDKLDTLLKNLNFSARLTFCDYLGLCEIGLSMAKAYDVTVGTSFNEDNLVGYFHLSRMYADDGQYDRGVTLSSELKEYVRTHSIVNDQRNSLLINDVDFLFGVEKYKQVISETDSLLKTRSNPNMIFHCRYYNGLSKLRRSKYYKALFTFGELQRCFPSTNYCHNVVMRAYIMFYLLQCLIAIGRFRQALHMAREGRNFAIENELTIFVELFSRKNFKKKNNLDNKKKDLEE